MHGHDVVQVHGLSKWYRRRKALDELTFAVSAGEIFGLVGAAGAGKSTALACMAGLVEFEAGHVRIFGRDLANDARALRQDVGFMPDDLSLPGVLRVHEAMATFTTLYDRTTDRDLLLDRLRLRDIKGQIIGRLTRGAKQRLSLALALLSEPKLLFIDEPTTGLSDGERQILWRAILAFRDAGGTVVLSTALTVEAQSLCDRIALLDQGRIIVLGCPQQLMDRLLRSRRITFNVSIVPGLAEAMRNLQQLNGMVALTRQGNQIVIIGEGQTLVASAVGVLAEFDVPVMNLRTDQPRFDDLLVALTDRSWTGGDMVKTEGDQ